MGSTQECPDKAQLLIIMTCKLRIDSIHTMYVLFLNDARVKQNLALASPCLPRLLCFCGNCSVFVCVGCGKGWGWWAQTMKAFWNAHVPASTQTKTNQNRIASHRIAPRRLVSWEGNTTITWAHFACSRRTSAPPRIRQTTKQRAKTNVSQDGQD